MTPTILTENKVNTYRSAININTNILLTALVSSTKSLILGFKIFIISVRFLLDGMIACSGYASSAFESRRCLFPGFFASELRNKNHYDLN